VKRTIHEPFSIRGNVSSSNTEIHVSENLNHLQQTPASVCAINLQQTTLTENGHTERPFCNAEKTRPMGGEFSTFITVSVLLETLSTATLQGSKKNTT